MPQRTARAEWTGDLRSGSGNISLASGAFSSAYSWESRFASGKGTNPEELIAAAHAGCYSMATAAGLAKAGFPPNRVATTATVNLESDSGGFSIKRIDLKMEANVPAIDDATFQKIADEAKKGCPVSRALAAVEITLEARLQK